MSRSKNDKASKKNRNTFRDDKLEEILRKKKKEKETATKDAALEVSQKAGAK